MYGKCFDLQLLIMQYIRKIVGIAFEKINYLNFLSKELFTKKYLIVFYPNFDFRKKKPRDINKILSNTNTINPNYNTIPI